MMIEGNSPALYFDDATSDFKITGEPTGETIFWSGEYDTDWSETMVLKENKVGINTTTIDSGLAVDVNGNVGANFYCDQAGQNCFQPEIALADLSCPLGQIAKYDDGWACGNDVEGSGSGLWSKNGDDIYYISGDGGVALSTSSYISSAANFYISSNGQVSIAGANPAVQMLRNGEPYSNFQADSNGIFKIQMDENRDGTAETVIALHPNERWGWYMGDTAPDTTVHSSGTVRANSFRINSDERLKKEISTFQNGLETVLSLEGKYFTWKKNEQKSFGLIAQEVEKILPKIVQTGDATGFKSIDYNALVAPLIEAIKQQQQQIDTLNQEKAQRIKDLEQTADRLIDEIRTQASLQSQ
jgi:hypothetical protein